MATVSQGSEADRSGPDRPSRASPPWSQRRALALLVVALLIVASVVEVVLWKERSSPPGGPALGGPPVTIYVSTAGDDNWSGTLSAPNSAGTDGPFDTIGRAQVAVQNALAQNPRPGSIHVAIENGSYYLSSPLTFGPGDSGDPILSSAPLTVVYENASGAAPVLLGGRAVSGWSEISTSPDLWSAPLTGYSYFEQLWVNGVRHYRPTTTNGSYLYIAGPVTVPTKTGSCPTPAGSAYLCYDRFRFYPGDLSASYYNESSVEIEDFEDWTMPILHLRWVDTTNDIAYLYGNTSQSTYHGFLKGHRYLVTNVRENLTRPGEWYFDRPNDRLLYVASPGEDPRTESFMAPQTTQLLVANGLHDATFRGLTFSYTNWIVPRSGWASTQGESLFTQHPVSAALQFSNATDVTLTGLTVAHVGGYAIAFSGGTAFSPAPSKPFDNEVTNSSLFDTGAGGIRVGLSAAPSDTAQNVPAFTLITNDVVEGVGRMLPGGYAIYVLNAHNSTVTHDLVYDTYNTGIGVGSMYNSSYARPNLAYGNLVAYDRVYDIGQGVTSDIGGIYIADYTAGGNRIIGNVIHDVTHNDVTNTTTPRATPGYGGWGIYFDAGSSNVLAESNLVYRTSEASVHMNYGSNDSLFNNILAWGTQGMITRSHNWGGLTINVARNILLWDSNASQGPGLSTPGSFQDGLWACFSACASHFYFEDNLYWYTGGVPSFVSTQPLQSYSLGTWQTLGEDTGSLVANPMFVDDRFPADNFTLSPGSPGASVGFLPFQTALVGPLSGVYLVAPAVPPAFPLQTLDPFSGF